MKWPNDVQIDGRKVSGILSSVESVRNDWIAVVGMGINVNEAPDLASSISVAEAVGRQVSRELLVQAVLSDLERLVEEAGKNPNAVRSRWVERLDTLDRNVCATAVDRVVIGRAVDVDAEGSLIIVDNDLQRHVVRAADVTLSPT